LDNIAHAISCKSVEEVASATESGENVRVRARISQMPGSGVVMVRRILIRSGVAVAAVLRAGLMAASAAPSSHAAVSVPGAPTALSVTLGRSVGEVRLTWTAPTDTGGGIATYSISEATVTDGVTGPWSEPASLRSTSVRNTRTCTAAYPAVCAYRVVAVNAAGTSAASNVATMAWAVPSAAVRTRAVPAGAHDFSANDISWNPAVRTGGLPVTYDVQIRVDGGVWTDVATGLSVLTLADDAHCTGGTSCLYRVRSQNAVGYGPNSNSSALAVRPTAVTALAATITAVDPTMGNPTSGASTVSVSWALPRAGLVDGPYEVQGCLDSCDAGRGTWTATVTVANASTSLAAPCAADYRTCTYRVRATNTRGGVGVWTYRSITPFAPRLVSAATGTTVDTIDVTFNGVAETGTGAIVDKRFDFWTCTASCSVAANWSTDLAESVSLADITAFPATQAVACPGAVTCQVRVRFTDGSGSAGPLSIAAGAPVATLPGVPTDVVASTGVVDAHVAVTWSAPADVGTPALTGYEHRVSFDGSNWSGWTATGSTSTSASVDCTGGGVTCHVQVRAINAIGAGDPSDADSATSATPPGQLTLTGAAASSTAGSIDLTWETANFDAGYPDYTDVEFRVKVNSGSYGSWTSTGTTSGSYTDSSCGSGNVCTYQVRAVNAVAPGLGSNEESATAD
jgi:titin